MRNLRRGFLTMDTADLHLLRVSSEGLLGSTSKFSLRYFSILLCFKLSMLANTARSVSLGSMNLKVTKNED
jgi:hypothetical protein